MTIRVVQFATGQTGKHALRGILTHPELELVGLLVHDPAKAGLDAGELCGLGPVGVTATIDGDEALLAGADCVAEFQSWGDGARQAQIIDDAAQLLRAGIDIVSVSVPTFVYPYSPANDPVQVKMLETAALEG